MKFFSKFLWVALVAAVGAAAVGGLQPAQAQVSVNINLGPPPIVVAEPPAVVMVPESRVFYVPDPQLDIFFFGGYWWSPRGDRWYRARAYNGPWGLIERSRVPRAVIYVPRDYRGRYEREEHIPYGQWKKDRDRLEREHRKSHKKWEKEREREWRDEQQRDRREDRGGRDDRDGHDDHGGHGRGR